jgi:hypothetical protein
MSINARRNFVQVGHESVANPAATGPDAVTNALTQLLSTRGSIDLNENRLPNADDLTVRPTDPIVAYNAFVVSAAGNAPAGVTRVTALNVGDYLVLSVDADPTVASNWMGLTNVALSSFSASTYSGAHANWYHIVDTPLPFFPLILFGIGLSAAIDVLCNLSGII